MTIDTACIGVEKFDAFKVVQLSGGRREFCFLANRCIPIGTLVSVRATYFSISSWVTEVVSGNRRRKEGMYEIFVIDKGKEWRKKNGRGE
jgi:hypothetical protein